MAKIGYLWNVSCGHCGMTMLADEQDTKRETGWKLEKEPTIYCGTTDCPEYGKRYKVPIVNLEPKPV